MLPPTGGCGVDPMNPMMTQMVGGPGSPGMSPVAGMNPMMSMPPTAGGGHGGHWSTVPPRHHYHSHRRRRKGLFASIFGHDRYPGQTTSEAAGMLSCAGIHHHDDYHHGHRPYHERPPSGFFAPAYPAPLMHHPNQMMSGRFYDTGQPPLYWHEDSDSSSEEDFFAGFADDLDVHPMRIYVWVSALVALGLSVLLMTVTCMAMGRDDFQTFSALTNESGYFSFWVLLFTLVCLALFSVVLSMLSFYVGWKESIPVLRALDIVEIALAIVILLIALLTCIQSNRSTPDLIRSANVICQDPSVWGCDGIAAVNNTMSEVRVVDMGVDSGGAKLRRLLTEDEEEGDDASLALSYWGAFWRGRRLSESSATPRRLAASTSAVSAENYLTDEGRFPTQASKCARVAEMCVPPPGFNAKTSCVCNGVGAIVTTTTVTTRTFTTPNITETTTSTRSTTTTTTSTPLTTSSSTVTSLTTTMTTLTTTTLGDALDDIPGAKLRRLRSGGVVEAAAQEAAPVALDDVSWGPAADSLQDPEDGALEEPAPERMERDTTAADYWEGTIGAYCGAWDEGDPDWCFSNPGQHCNSGAVAPSDGKYKKSSGPCGDSVDSRSKYVLEGQEALNVPLGCAVLLAFSLLGIAAVGLTKDWPVHEFIDMPGLVHQHHGPRVVKRDPIEERFVKAQELARQKVKKETANDMRLALFGYYRQATEGDVRGPRPNFFSSENRLKYDYWAKNRGMSRHTAMEKYSDLVDAMVD